jgi:hypothetical protein
MKDLKLAGIAYGARKVRFPRGSLESCQPAAQPVSTMDEES